MSCLADRPYLDEGQVESEGGVDEQHLEGRHLHPDLERDSRTGREVEKKKEGCVSDDDDGGESRLSVVTGQVRLTSTDVWVSLKSHLVAAWLCRLLARAVELLRGGARQKLCWWCCCSCG